MITQTLSRIPKNPNKRLMLVFRISRILLNYAGDFFFTHVTHLKLNVKDIINDGCYKY